MVCDMLLVVLVAGFAIGWVRGTWSVCRRTLSGFYNSRVLRKRRRPEPARSLASAGSLMSMRGASSVMMRINSLYVTSPQSSVRVRGAGMGNGASAAAAAAVARVALVDDGDAAADSPPPSFSSSSRARRVLRRQGSTLGRQPSSAALGSRGASGSLGRQGSSTTASFSVRRQGSTAVAFAKTWSRLQANSAALLALGGGGGGDGGGPAATVSGGARPLGEGTEAGHPDHRGLRLEAADSSQLEVEEIASPTLPCVPTHLGTHLGDGAWTAAPVSRYAPPPPPAGDCCESDDDDDGAASVPIKRPHGRPALGRTSTLHPRLSPYGQGVGGGAEEQEDSSKRPASKGNFASILKSR